MQDSFEGDGLVLLWSGGKDAMLSHDVLHSQSPRRIRALLTTIEEDTNTVSMHGTPLSIIHQQAESLEIPLHVMQVPANAPNSTYEARLQHALRPLLTANMRKVVAGDLFLQDVKAYRRQVLTDLGATPLFPLWKRNTDWLAHRFLERGYRALVTSVDTTQLAAEYVGRVYDKSFLEELPSGIDPCGEEGAFHTVVVDGPPFRSRLAVEVDGVYGEGRMRYARFRALTEDESAP